jgi:hypothetical protein
VFQLDCRIAALYRTSNWNVGFSKTSAKVKNCTGKIGQPQTPMRRVKCDIIFKRVILRKERDRFLQHDVAVLIRMVRQPSAAFVASLLSIAGAVSLMIR